MHIQIYGHFEEYNVPDENGESLFSVDDNFLDYVYDYFYTKRKNNSYYLYDNDKDYKEEAKSKKFILSRINDQSYDLGKEWLDNRTKTTD